MRVKSSQNCNTLLPLSLSSIHNLVYEQAKVEVVGAQST